MRQLRVDGGATRNDLLTQHQANILNGPVVRPVIMEITTLSAVHLAGLALSFWSSKQEIAAQGQMEKRFEPNMLRDEREQTLHI